MAHAWDEPEIKFQLVEDFNELEKVCPMHGTGEKDFEELRYRCNVCKKLLNKR